MPRADWWLPSAEETALLTLARLDLRLLTWIVAQDLIRHYDLDALPARSLATKREGELAALAVYRATHTYLERRKGQTLPIRLAELVWEPPNTARLAIEQVSTASAPRSFNLQLLVVAL